MNWWKRALAAATGALICGLWTGAAVGAPGSPSVPPSATTAPGRPLVLAHYYIWFDRTSWDRAKRDYPLIGRYSSSDTSVMRTQIAQAKSAGIDGFIVSWKSTPLLDARLRDLVRVAQEAHFKLAITYEGLTFDRVNLPPRRVAADLDVFVRRFASSPVFDIFGKPLVVLTGTPGMTAADVATIAGSRRSRLAILATAKNAADYDRVAGLVDGDLYYWSSVNPATYPDYAAKLDALGNAVRAHRGIWIAPAAPGFDARLVGGRSVVDRAAGATLRTEWSAALTSLPDAIGIISWNEYSENTYIEPSARYGNTYLREVRALTGAQASRAGDFDSSAPGGASSPWRPVAVFGTSFALLAGLTVVARRRRERGRHLAKNLAAELARHRRARAVAGLLVVAAVLVAVREGYGHGHSRRAPIAAPAVARATAPRPDGTQVCPSVVPAAVPAGLEARDRVLVPYSATVLGVDTQWVDGAGHRSVEIISGGYIDDITEPYDDLRQDAGVRVSGATATVLTTVFLHVRVWVAFWRQPGVPAPCDVHAVIARDLPRADFYALLSGIR